MDGLRVKKCRFSYNSKVSLSLSEEVEIVKPLHVDKKKLLKGLKMAQTVREFLRYQASHTYKMRLGDYLVMREHCSSNVN